MRWILVVAVIGLVAGSADARSEKTLAYQREQAWPAAVRFLVVDERLKVTEKDADAGYVLFELRDEGKTFRGSLEVMTVVTDGRTSVRFVVQIQDRPSWLELAMLARLESKLRAELGSPSPAPSKPEPPPKDGKEGKDGKDKEPPKHDDDALPISPTP